MSTPLPRLTPATTPVDVSPRARTSRRETRRRSEFDTGDGRRVLRSAVHRPIGVRASHRLREERLDDNLQCQCFFFLNIRHGVFYRTPVGKRSRRRRLLALIVLFSLRSIVTFSLLIGKKQKNTGALCDGDSSRTDHSTPFSDFPGRMEQSGRISYRWSEMTDGEPSASVLIPR